LDDPTLERFLNTSAAKLATAEDLLARHTRATLVTAAKPFCGFDANVLKPPPRNDAANSAPK
jgi:hypothetical protein